MTSPAAGTDPFDVPTAALHRPPPRPGADQPVAPPMRASDAERTATVLLLQDAVAQGCLTPDEGSERMARAYAATFRHDLPPLTVDLPRTVAVQPPASPPATLSERLAGLLPAGGADRVRLALLLALGLLLIMTTGSVVAHLLFDGGPGWGPMPGMGRR